MSDKALARRTEAKVFFGGVDITKDIAPYILSVEYTDNEEDETDDLQLKLQDRDGLWLQKWLNTAIYAAAGGTARSPETTKYTVIATTGVNVRAGEGMNYAKLGSLAYGAAVSVRSITGSWAQIDYSGGTGYIEASAIKIATVNDTEWAVGDEVTVSGRPQYTSYGEGTPGAAVTNYTGKITYLNLNAPYPVHVGYLGWFEASQVSKVGTASKSDNIGVASKGLSIQAVFLRENWNGDGSDEMLECGQFELDSVQASGPPSTVTIKGTSLPYSSSVRQTEKSRSWENYTLKGIVTEIASRNGMTSLYSGAGNPSYKRVEQYRTSDIAFLKKLCHDAGYSLKVSNNIIIVFEQSVYEKRDAVVTIENGKSSYSKYTLKTGKDKTYTSCRVSWVTPSGSCISGEAFIEDYKEDKEDNQCLEISQKVSSVAEAKTLAEMHLKLHNKYELTATFSMPGDPRLLAGCTVNLVGWGPWDGKYIIKQAKHSISGSGYQTSVTLRKIIGSAGASVSSVTAGGFLDDIARAVIRGEWGNGSERRRRLTEAGYDYEAVQARVNELLGY